MSADLRLLDRLAALQARLDARRKAKVSPGQLGLDLTGGGAGGGAGTGKACGQSHISRAKTCRKGAGGAAGDPAAVPPASTKSTRKARPSAPGTAGKARMPGPEVAGGAGGLPSPDTYIGKAFDRAGLRSMLDKGAPGGAPDDIDQDLGLATWYRDARAHGGAIPLPAKDRAKLQKELEADGWANRSDKFGTTTTWSKIFYVDPSDPTGGSGWNSVTFQVKARGGPLRGGVLLIDSSITRPAPEDAARRVRLARASSLDRERAHSGIGLDKPVVREQDGARSFLPSFRPADGALGDLQRAAAPIAPRVEDRHKVLKKWHIPDLDYWGMFEHERRFEAAPVPISASRQKELEASLTESGFAEDAPGRWFRSRATTSRPVDSQYGALPPVYRREYVKKVDLDGFEAAHEVVIISEGAARYSRTEQFVSVSPFLDDHLGKALGRLTKGNEVVTAHHLSDGSYALKDSVLKGRGQEVVQLFESPERLAEVFENRQKDHREIDYGFGQRGPRSYTVKGMKVDQPLRMAASKGGPG